MLSFIFVIWTLMACQDADWGCLDRDVEDWCTGGQAEAMPDESGACPELSFEPGPLTWRCGDIDYVSSGPDFAGQKNYFDHETGELIAVEFWTDVDGYCGEYSYWYGQRIDLDSCERCTYDPESVEDDVPLCD